MKNEYFQEHWSDTNGNPSGGTSSGRGFTIAWQNGPLGRDNERKEANGAFVEDVLDAVIQRIEFYQRSKFACEENAKALVLMKDAATALAERTIAREKRKVEGTHQV